MSELVDEEFTKPKEATKGTKAEAKKKPFVLRNVNGKDMKEEDYFFKATENGGKAPSYFNATCGYPVDREELVDVFNEIFDPKDNVLFYKTPDKELYLIIIPLKYSTTVSKFHESVDGDFQKHAISFIQEGSANLETLRSKLKRIETFCDFREK